MVATVLFAPLVSHAGSAFTKLGRGAANVITSPVEIFYRTGKGDGVLVGLYKMGERAVVGLYEVITFLFPVPAGYEPIIKDPEMFIQK